MYPLTSRTEDCLKSVPRVAVVFNVCLHIQSSIWAAKYKSGHELSLSHMHGARPSSDARRRSPAFQRTRKQAQSYFSGFMTWKPATTATATTAKSAMPVSMSMVYLLVETSSVFHHATGKLKKTAPSPAPPSERLSGSLLRRPCGRIVANRRDSTARTIRCTSTRHRRSRLPPSPKASLVVRLYVRNRNHSSWMVPPRDYRTSKRAERPRDRLTVPRIATTNCQALSVGQLRMFT
jgi:hypothetical protein